jgi:hypothetical protein
MEVILSSETSAHTRTTRFYIPEDDKFHVYDNIVYEIRTVQNPDWSDRVRQLPSDWPYLGPLQADPKVFEMRLWPQPPRMTGEGSYT